MLQRASLWTAVLLVTGTVLVGLSFNTPGPAVFGFVALWIGFSRLFIGRVWLLRFTAGWFLAAITWGVVGTSTGAFDTWPTTARPSEPAANTGSTPTARPMPAPRSTAWYSGGSLHDATMAEWRRATAADRLATSADFVTRLLQVDKQRIPPVDQLRPVAVQLEECMTRANRDGVADNRDTAEIAATCWVMMQRMP